MPERRKTGVIHLKEEEKHPLYYEQIEKKIIELVKKAGEDGIIQRELWKLIGLDSRRGVRIIRRLEQQGIISRSEIIYKGRKTYILRPAIMMKAKTVIPDFLDDIPCMFCPELPRCESGERNVINCPILNKWIEKKRREYGV